jgi:hypothetical protein
MGHVHGPDGAHTHGGGGSGLGTAVLIILAVALLGPAVAAAVAELLRILLLVVVVMVCISAAVLAGTLAWRRRRLGAARAGVLPESRWARAAPTPSLRPAPRAAIEQQRQVHLHFHGTDPAEIAEIIRRQQEDP